MNLVTGRINLSGALIFNSKKEFLLLFKRKYNHWELPGGKVGLQEDIKKTALREIWEEIGCKVRLSKYFGAVEFSHKGNKYASHTFRGKIVKGIPCLHEPGVFSAIGFFSLKDAKKLKLAPNMEKMVSKPKKFF